MKNGGGRLDWSAGDLVVFDQLGSDLYYDVYTMNPTAQAARDRPGGAALERYLSEAWPDAGIR